MKQKPGIWLARSLNSFSEAAAAVNTAAAALSQPVICVVGPTASGKTDVAQIIATKLRGEVVSADSMQVYRGMDIGTGKLPERERLVTHYGFDLVDPGEPYSAALFQEYARRSFVEIEAKGKRSILAGGTGFYVRAAIDAYEFPDGEQIDNPVRERWNAFAAERGSERLWEELNKRDPESASLIPPADVKRVVRAFELLEAGESYAIQKQRLQTLPQWVPAVFVGLSVDPDILRARIRARVDSMIDNGLIEEVEALLASGFRDGITAPQAIGYKEIVAALDGCTSMEEAVESIKVSTCRYAKRQRTWFKKDSRIHWLCADSGDTTALANEAISLIDTL